MLRVTDEPFIELFVWLTGMVDVPSHSIGVSLLWDDPLAFFVPDGLDIEDR